MINEFVPNEQYIEFLKINAELAKKKADPVQVAFIKKKLTGFELKMTAADILRNTHIAFLLMDAK